MVILLRVSSSVFLFPSFATVTSGNGEDRAFDPLAQAMSNNGNSQVLDGGSNARILLKACMDKTVVTKLPYCSLSNYLLSFSSTSRNVDNHTAQFYVH
jgi:hypothetical protein